PIEIQRRAATERPVGKFASEDRNNTETDKSKMVSKRRFVYTFIPGGKKLKGETQRQNKTKQTENAVRAAEINERDNSFSRFINTEVARLSLLFVLMEEKRPKALHKKRKENKRQT
ncbi:hypothetical protein BaRGS_00004038, partial [Batillaria attramentaria]